MKKKQTKHFVLNMDQNGAGIPLCDGFQGLQAFTVFGEVAKTRRGVTCGNCQRTRVFRKLK